MDYGKDSLAARQKWGGQIGTQLKQDLNTVADLATFYSPGIAHPCEVIAQDKSLSRELTIRRNTVAVVSDGSAVLGLGNIGPEAGLPVMEGKAMLFKKFGGVDAFPIVLDTQDTEEIIETVVRIAPTFGGINLEDISAPRCFEIEQRLTEILDIPVFHDDQHGTAIVVLAGLINALRIVNKKKEDLRVVINGAGAAGIAIFDLLKFYWIEDIALLDSKGIASCSREDLNDQKKARCYEGSGDLSEAVKDIDVFIGVSKGGLLTGDMIQSMNRDPIIFGLANPIPEIMPEVAYEAGARIVATGRSDFSNQINNVLVFPGLFRGLLDMKATKVTPEMKLAVGQALADFVEDPSVGKIIPHPFDSGVADTVAQAVKDFLQ